jgi:hypothetical protein
VNGPDWGLFFARSGAGFSRKVEGAAAELLDNPDVKSAYLGI